MIVVSTTWKPVFSDMLLAWCVRANRMQCVRICEALGWAYRVYSFYSYTIVCMNETGECNITKAKRLWLYGRANCIHIREPMSQRSFFTFCFVFNSLYISWFHWFSVHSVFVVFSFGSNCSVDDQEFVSFKEEAFVFFGDEEFTLRFFLFCFVFICNQH